MGHLVDLLRKEPRRGTTWQRQLAARLVDVDRDLQVLRMTLALDKGDSEILAAADALAGVCHLAVMALAGTRADHMTKAAVGLVDQLASSIATSVQRVYAGNRPEGA